MMSAADLNAMQESERTEKRRQDVEAMLARCDQSHPNKITPEKFTAVCRQVFTHPSLANISAAYEIDAMGVAVAKGEKTVLDALYECFIRCPRSINHLNFLITKLFDLQITDEAEISATQQQFVRVFNKRNRKQQGQKFFTDALARCGQSHPQKITFKTFSEVVDEILDSKKKVLPEDYYGFFSEFQEYRASLKLTVYRDDILEVLFSYLRLEGEKHDVFKFLLIAQLFNLKEEDEQESKAIVEGFLNALVQLKKDEKDRYCNEIIERINKMSQQEFKAVCTVANTMRAAINGQATRNTIGFTGSGWANEVDFIIGLLVAPPYLVGKGAKSLVRGIAHSSIESQVVNERRGVFAAIYEFLNSNIGRNSSRSFKFTFILALCGFTYEEKRYVVPNTDLTKYLDKLRRIGNGPDDFIHGLTQAMEASREEKNTSMHASVEAYVRQCHMNIPQETFLSALKSVRAARALEVKRDNITIFGGIANLVKSPTKTAPRNKAYDVIEAKLAIGEITSLAALSEILNGIGSTGPHSLKYALLKKLFEDLNKDIAVTAEESSKTITLFIRAINEFEKSLQQAIPLEEMTSAAPTLT